MKGLKFTLLVVLATLLILIGGFFPGPLLLLPETAAAPAPVKAEEGA